MNGKVKAELMHTIKTWWSIVGPEEMYSFLKTIVEHIGTDSEFDFLFELTTTKILIKNGQL